MELSLGFLMLIALDLSDLQTGKLKRRVGLAFKMFDFKKHSSEFLKKPKNKEETEENSLLSKYHYQQTHSWHILSDILLKSQTLHY